MSSDDYPSLPLSTSEPLYHESLPETFEQLDEVIASYKRGNDATPWDRRNEINRLSTRLRTDIEQNVSNAWNESMESQDHTFTPFSRLPIELRFLIWEYALSTPRIIEVGKVPRTRPFEYKTKTVPPLFYANRESRRTAQSVYRSGASPAELSAFDRGNWIRYGYDIVHLRNFEFSEPEAGYENTVNTIPQTWEPFGVRQWSDWPRMFEHFRTLSLSRETMGPSLSSFSDLCPTLLRHFFPNLSTLIVLIDHEVDFWHIRRENNDWWRARGIDTSSWRPIMFDTYENVDSYRASRRLFSETCTGPFLETPADVADTGMVEYKKFIQREIQDKLDWEEWAHKDHNAPMFIFRSARLPSRSRPEESTKSPGYKDSHQSLPETL